jgi:hypothetical protein
MDVVPDDPLIEAVSYFLPRHPGQKTAGRSFVSAIVGPALENLSLHSDNTGHLK